MNTNPDRLYDLLPVFYRQRDLERHLLWDLPARLDVQVGRKLVLLQFPLRRVPQA